MIKLKMSIEDISEYQTGILPKNAVKIETPQSIEEMMKKAAWKSLVWNLRVVKAD